MYNWIMSSQQDQGEWIMGTVKINDLAEGHKSDMSESTDIYGNTLYIGYRVMYRGKVYEIGAMSETGEILYLSDMSDNPEIPVECCFVALV